MTTTKIITVRQLAERGRNGQVDLIDVRTPVEFRDVHADIARNIPLDALDPEAIMSARGESGDQPLYVICRSGARSAKAQKQFIDAGFENVVNVDGGTEAWVAAGLPVVRGKKAMSLERQVRIAAGFLVLSGVLLSVFVHPYWVGVSGFVGAGLMFAGITDSCAMGMLLAKMPWNQASGETCCPAGDSPQEQCPISRE